MPHYDLELSDDGTISRILRDGEPYQDTVHLEQVYSIVTTYFVIASTNLTAIRAAEDQRSRRFHGLQAFLMSLTGTEAFTNIFFSHWARHHDLPELANRIEQRASLLARLTDALSMAFNQPIVGQEELLARIRDLYLLRHQIVHPRWEPSSLSMPGEEGSVVIEGLTQNFQAAFENEAFCREAYLWCLLLVARVGRACGDSGWGFCFHWTGEYGLTEDAIAAQLGLN